MKTDVIDKPLSNFKWGIFDAIQIVANLRKSVYHIKVRLATMYVHRDH